MKHAEAQALADQLEQDGYIWSIFGADGNCEVVVHGKKSASQSPAPDEWALLADRFLDTVRPVPLPPSEAEARARAAVAVGWLAYKADLDSQEWPPGFGDAVVGALWPIVAEWERTAALRETAPRKDAD